MAPSVNLANLAVAVDRERVKCRVFPVHARARPCTPVPHTFRYHSQLLPA